MQDHVADVFMKGLFPNEFEENVCKLGMYDIHVQLKRECWKLCEWILDTVIRHRLDVGALSCIRISI